MSRGFTRDVREELARRPPPERNARRAELAALLRFGGRLLLRGGGQPVAVAITLRDGPVARRLVAGLSALYGLHSDIEVHRPSNLEPATSYRLTVEDATALADLGILGGDGKVASGLREPLVSGRAAGQAAVAGAFMAAGSISSPRAAAHLEIRAPGEVTATDLARLVPVSAAVAVSCVQVTRAGSGGSWRVVVKSAAAIGRLLGLLGAHSALLAWEDGHLRRELRADANRVANADRANLRRTVAAASAQVAVIDAFVADHGWDAIPEDLRDVALARLANPEASLRELAAILEPPASKAAVHRRLARLAALASG